LCHSIESVSADGNGSFTLSDQPILIPDPAVPQEVEAHRSRLTMEPLRSGALCGACHRSFSGAALGNPNHLAGIDDLGDWRESGYGGGVPDVLAESESATCQDCHMEAESTRLGDFAATDGFVSNHRWAASHTAMANQLDEQQFARTRDTLKRAATIHLGSVEVDGTRFLLPEEARLRGGRHLTLEVATCTTSGSRSK
jgi:hypothetical protein